MAHGRAFNEGPEAAIESPAPDTPRTSPGASEELLLRVQRSAGNAATGALVQRFHSGGVGNAPALQRQGHPEPERQSREARQAGAASTSPAGPEPEHQPREAREAGLVEASGDDGLSATGNAGRVTASGSIITGGLLKALSIGQLGVVPEERFNEAVSFVGRLSDAVATGWATWQSAASLVGVSVNAVTASGGTLIGPPIAPSIVGAGTTTDETIAAASLAGALQAAHFNWQGSFKLPGLPLYPSFAAFPGPVAPPTPGTPMPVITVPANVGAFELAPSLVFAPDPVALAAARAVAGGFQVAFMLWLATTNLVNLLGTGPVPSFSPPDVMVGPVVGGVALGVPPVLV